MARYEEFIVNKIRPQQIIVDLGTNTSTDGLSPEIWSEMPLLNMVVDPTLGYTTGDDFNQISITGFPYKIQGANGTAVALTTAPSVLLMTATGADNDECYVTSNNALSGIGTLNATKDWAFEARVKISQITTAQGIFVGLAGPSGGVGVDFMTDDTMALKVIDLLGFQVIAATDVAAVFQTMYNKTSGTRQAVNATAITSAAATWMKLGMKSVSGTVSFYYNDAKLSGTVASSATNFPLNVVVNANFATKCGTAVANTLQIDWWRFAQLR